MYYTAESHHRARMRRICQSSGSTMALVLEDYDTPAGRTISADEWVESVISAIKAMMPVPLRILRAVDRHRPGAILSAIHDTPDYPLPIGFVAHQQKNTLLDAFEESAAAAHGRL